MNVYAAGDPVVPPDGAGTVPDPTDGVGAGKPGPKPPTDGETATDGTDRTATPSGAGAADRDPVDEVAPPPTLAIGGLDPNGATVTCIHAATRRYVVYEAGAQVRYLLPDDYRVGRLMRRRVAPLGGLRASIEGLRSEAAIGPPERARAGRELAWALGEAFEDEDDATSDQPKQVLARVDARLRSLVKSQYRRQYVLGNIKAFALLEAGLLAILVLSSSGLGDSPVTHDYAGYAVCGALGAFLSVISSVRSLDFDLNLTTWEHVFAGATRIMIGVIGAWVVALALNSALVDPTFGGQGRGVAMGARDVLTTREAMYLFLCFIAGFSESLVPNLLRRGEEAVGDGSAPPRSVTGPIMKDMKP